MAGCAVRDHDAGTARPGPDLGARRSRVGGAGPRVDRGDHRAVGVLNDRAAARAGQAGRWQRRPRNGRAGRRGRHAAGRWRRDGAAATGRRRRGGRRRAALLGGGVDVVVPAATAGVVVAVLLGVVVTAVLVVSPLVCPGLLPLTMVAFAGLGVLAALAVARVLLGLAGVVQDCGDGSGERGRAADDQRERSLATDAGPGRRGRGFRRRRFDRRHERLSLGTRRGRRTQ